MKRGAGGEENGKKLNSTTNEPKEDTTHVVYEDPFVDQYEEEEFVEDNEEDEDKVEELNGEEEETERHDVFKIGKDKMEEGERMEYDNSAYRMYHRLNVEWPCLSFDIITDNLGVARKRYPHTLYTVAGTQAENIIDNHIVVSKMFSLCKTQYDDDPEEAEPDDYDQEAKIVYDTIPHHGAVNRIRCLPDRPQIVGVWSDQGIVSIYNIAPQLSALENGHSARDQEGASRPLFQFKGHRSEGYAIDWSRCAKGTLATGDCSAQIFVTSPAESGWRTDPQPFVSHEASVEDLQWSPSEATVFASCSVDRTVRFWDTRNPSRQCMLSVNAHDSDVNVINWNKQVGYLVVSGSDDGTFRIWDIRNLNGGCVGNFNYLDAPITSVEWSPHDSSVLAVSSDQQLTIWDLSLEADAADQIPEVPSQLLFVHAGQNEIKELHFHPQIPDMVVSTAQDGFNCFIPDISVGEEMEEE
ncbi:glutamate-rich WD repeat-containing protein [Blastocystis sp. ATCC 50177/Nand II]|uniref:Glutamate-rich WD repeat-containing protein 1 n=1 Tax=Blastocystis sp. subtype 1 (strain ATCC 50177 / NandII) TaxID=478820 RepID=A0A196SK10_BLAHN|nr:glutamate-rich WD repeat-containing protein [Blastocystis sp. ATCC 50177/Nand II]